MQLGAVSQHSSAHASSDICENAVLPVRDSCRGCLDCVSQWVLTAVTAWVTKVGANSSVAETLSQASTGTLFATSWLNLPSGKSVNPRSVTAECCSVLPPVAAVTVAIVLCSGRRRARQWTVIRVSNCLGRKKHSVNSNSFKCFRLKLLQFKKTRRRISRKQ